MMLDERQGTLLVRNLAILVGLALPVAVLGIAAYQFLTIDEASMSWLGDIALMLVVAVVPLSLGGALHQLLALKLPGTWSILGRRIALTITSPLVLCVIAVIIDLEFLLTYTAPIVVALAVYSGLSKLPA